MKLINKIKKADFENKTQLWMEAYLTKVEAKELVMQMILSCPKGCYKINNREHGTNLRDTVYEIYGWIPSMFVSESLLLGMQVLYPKKIYVSFTHDLDVIEIK